MSKALIFSDLHINNYSKYDIDGSRLDNCLKVLIEVFSTCEATGIETILFGGDLYDQQKSISTEVINKTLEIFKLLFIKYPKIKFYSISGNHDHSSKNTENLIAISALKHLEVVFDNFILADNERVCIDSTGRCIMGIPYYSHKEHFLSRIEEIDNDVYLLIHQTPKHSNPMIPYDCDPGDFSKFPYVFCGHIHKHEQVADNFVIVGSPLHRDLGDEGQDKGYLIFDFDTNTYERIVTDYPKFVRTNDVTDDYAVPIIDLPVEETTFDINQSSIKLMEQYAKNVGIDEHHLKIGLELL